MVKSLSTTYLPTNNIWSYKKGSPLKLFLLLWHLKFFCGWCLGSFHDFYFYTYLLILPHNIFQLWFLLIYNVFKVLCYLGALYSRADFWYEKNYGVETVDTAYLNHKLLVSTNAKLLFLIKTGWGGR